MVKKKYGPSMARYLQNFTGLDADLQRLSAAAPLISIWDDHEGEQAGRSW